MCLIFLFVIFASAIISEGYRASSDWQYLIFAQQWPTSSCLSQRTHECQIPPYVSSWTVHGIWPTGKYNSPSFCNRSLAFNVSAIKSIEEQLLVVWPNLYPKEGIYSFWKHEWLKHGTCATSVPQLDTELKYFSSAITAHNLYNILNILKEDGIIPDEYTTYSMSQLRIAMESKLGKKAVFLCKDAKGYDSPLLLNVFICLDKNLALMDCPEKDRHCKSPVLYLPLRSTKSQYIHIFHLQRYISFLPTTCYAVAGIVLLFVAVIFAWLFSSFTKNRENKMYIVFTDEKCN